MRRGPGIGTLAFGKLPVFCAMMFGSVPSKTLAVPTLFRRNGLFWSAPAGDAGSKPSSAVRGRLSVKNCRSPVTGPLSWQRAHCVCGSLNSSRPRSVAASGRFGFFTNSARE